MRIKLIIFLFCALVFYNKIKAQRVNTTQHVIGSSVLFPVIDNELIDTTIKLKATIKNLDFKTFKVFNSYKNEYYFADSIRVMYVTPFDVSRKSFSGMEIGLLAGLKNNLKNVKNGDAIDILANIIISNVKYQIGFVFSIKLIDKELYFIPGKGCSLEIIK